MENARTVSLYVAVFFWANIIGAITYAHIAFFSPYLANLPESTSLINERYGVRDENFWMMIHPFAIVSTLAALVLNWKQRERRRLIAASAFTYLVVIAATAIYFVPELAEFSESSQMTGVTARQWLERGRAWQYASWTRGLCMHTGFVLLLVALRRPARGAQSNMPQQKHTI